MENNEKLNQMFIELFGRLDMIKSEHREMKEMLEKITDRLTEEKI